MIIEGWENDLQVLIGTFNQRANSVAKWDKALAETYNSILELTAKANKISDTQKELDQVLDLIDSQQKELGDLLDDLSGKVLAVYSTASEKDMDKDRQATYLSAENVNKELDKVEDTLKSLIEMLNKKNTPSQSESDVELIIKILNNHLNCLQSIDRRCQSLESKIQEVEQIQKNARRQPKDRFQTR